MNLSLLLLLSAEIEVIPTINQSYEDSLSAVLTMSLVAAKVIDCRGNKEAEVILDRKAEQSGSGGGLQQLAQELRAVQKEVNQVRRSSPNCLIMIEIKFFSGTNEVNRLQ